MSERWQTDRLGKYCYIKARIGWRGLSASEYTESGPVLIAGKHIESGIIDWDACDHISEFRYRESSEIALAEGDVILTKDGTIGRVARVDSLPGKATINGTMMLIRPERGINYRYLYHVLNGAGFKKLVDDKVSGSSIPHIFQRDMVSLPISFPPIEHQIKLAQVLDTLDTAINETEAIIAKLKAVKQGLLHDLLTRGIDANGELRPPQAEAPHFYKSSPLGWIPKEWSVSTVADDFRVDSGITLGPHRVPRTRAHPYLRVANVHRSRLELNDVALLEASAAEAASKALRVDDLLLVEGHASTEEIGRCALVTEAAEGMLFQNHLFRLRAISLMPKFGLLWLNSSFVRSYWRNEAATSSGLNTINRTKLNRLGVAVPPRQEQEALVSCADATDARVEAENQALSKLQRQKAGLMDDLLTGRVRVTPLLEGAAV